MEKRRSMMNVRCTETYEQSQHIIYKFVVDTQNVCKLAGCSLLNALTVTLLLSESKYQASQQMGVCGYFFALLFL